MQKVNETIEITGIGFPNKGAELMLHAVMDQLRHRYGDQLLATCGPAKGQLNSFRTIVDSGAYVRVKGFYRRFDLGSPIGNILPARWLRMYGCFAEKEIGIVLDASGLRYSDKFGVGTARHALRQYRRVKQRGGKVILLPQAFGPFTCPKLKQVVREIWQNADLIFARERESFAYLSSLVGSQERIKVAPDFSNLVKGSVPKSMQGYARKICVIPNSKMLAGEAGDASKGYLQGMIGIIKECRKRKHPVFILNHEGVSDELICRHILDEINDPEVGFLSGLSALETKGVIGATSGVITSRFHGLVSALSQGVPSLATSWSHKYERLLEDYGVSHGLIDFNHAPSETSQKLKQWLQHVDDSQKDEHSRLRSISVQIQKESVKMWQQVFECIEK
jgi:colanic acid/amylovoran biosynthesis protein